MGLDMDTRTLLACLLLASVALAGCSGGDGGEVISNSDGPPPQSQESKKGWIFGTVQDTEGPLAGVRVTVGGAGSAATTNATGGFTIANVAAGTYDLTYSAEYYESASKQVEVQAGLGTRADQVLFLSMLAPNVPARDGLLVTYVDEDDTMLAAAGPPGGMTVTTDKTDDRSYYGYWKINADEGYNMAYLFVNLSWDPGELDQELGLRYFRGESLTDTEGTYYLVTPLEQGDAWKYFEIESEDIAEWGKRTWQVGVYPSQGVDEFPLGGQVPYHITVTAAILSDGALAA